MEIFTVENILALITLTLLEIVLGFDNIIVLTLIVNKLEKEKRNVARKLGMILAMFMRIGLLLSISAIMMLKNPILHILGQGFSGRDLILLAGGLFLIGKATFEIHENTEPDKHKEKQVKGAKKFWSAIFQIILVDLVFSLDSVITAVGMASDIKIMITAVVISMVLMMTFAKAVGEFIERHPTFKVLALSFLVLIGVMLVSESMGKHIEKGYIYFAMSFSLAVEFINLKVRQVRAESR
ncbi:MAG: TerC family protein [Proteobacteria bacterium]|nr:TerC family protein [Pseudomonadota bacterium]